SMNSTIQELVDQLMVEEWNSSTIYDGYYNECQPSKCSYSYETKNGLIYIITTVIGLRIFYSIINLFTTYEAPLRSYTQCRINVLKNALQEGIRNRDNIDIILLEQQFDHESEISIVGITKRIHPIRDEIKTSFYKYSRIRL
ncbi:unnamed protein product, partial [Adineta steineri]